jgi:hypothetical protein
MLDDPATNCSLPLMKELTWRIRTDRQDGARGERCEEDHRQGIPADLDHLSIIIRMGKGRRNNDASAGCQVMRDTPPRSEKKR